MADSANWILMACSAELKSINWISYLLSWIPALFFVEVLSSSPTTPAPQHQIRLSFLSNFSLSNQSSNPSMQVPSEFLPHSARRPALQPRATHRGRILAQRPRRHAPRGRTVQSKSSYRVDGLHQPHVKSAAAASSGRILVDHRVTRGKALFLCGFIAVNLWIRILPVYETYACKSID